MYDLGLEAFLAVVQTRNMSRAAAQLNLAQPTVSKRLQVLEQQIGSTLFERRNGVTLTPTGEAFIEIAERWALLKQQIETFHSKGAALSLSIGTNSSVMDSIFSPLFNALTQHRPRIHLRVITTHSSDAYNDIDLMRVNVAFSSVEMDHPTVLVEKCYTEPMVVLRRSGLEQAGKESVVHPHELNCEDELYVRFGGTYQIWHDKWWDPFCLGRNHVSTSLLVPVLMHNPEKWAIVPMSLALNALNSSSFTISRLSNDPPDRVVYKLTHKKPKASTVQVLNISTNI